jgi:DHA2 family multidrug resistance protein
LGGAFGIALANNYIAKQYATHRMNLVSNITDGASTVTESVNKISQGLISKTGDASGVTTKALGIINQSIERQAYYLSYLDTFRLITIFFILVIPLVVFLRAKKKSAEELKATQEAVSDAH